MPVFWSFDAPAPASHERILKGWRTSQGIVGLEPMRRMLRASSIQVHDLLDLQNQDLSPWNKNSLIHGHVNSAITTHVVQGEGSLVGQHF